MSRSTKSALLAAAVLGFAPMATAQGDTSAKQRVIVLAFDGADHGLTQQYIAAGELPNLAKLAGQGTFSRLETTNPAESAVSWSSFGRGLNPGRTNMLGFVSRKPGTYFPEIRFMRKGERAAADFYAATDAPAGDAGAPAWRHALAGILALVATVLVGRLVLGPRPAFLIGVTAGGSAAVVSVVLGGGGGDRPALPDMVPTLEQVVEGKPLWNRLDEAGYRVKGFLVPMSTPIDPLENGQMSGGLGVPDIAGNSTGAYYIFSTAAADIPAGRDRRGVASSGAVIRLDEDDSGVLTAELPGPEDTAREAEVEARIEALGYPANDAERAELEALKREKKDGFDTSVTVRVERAGAGQVTVTLADRPPVTVAEGAWSDLISVRYPIRWPLDAPGLARFRVLEAGDEIRLFFTPLGYDPREVPEHMRMEWPPGFSRSIAADAGLYDTTGWACLTNPLKDVEVDEAVFLEHIKKLTAERSRAVYSELAKDDYDFFFAMFGETDRVQHMMYRVIDEQNPMYDPEVARQHGSAVVDAYKAMDDIVGEVMERFVDERTHLLVVSDHGFTSFRRQMSINSWLIQEGYLVPTVETEDPAALQDILPENRQNYLLYMDSGRSRAFALGLGKIYINVSGREKNGIVDPADYDDLCTEMTERLMALRDPVTGDPVVQQVWRREELYTGTYADTDADLFLGFAPYYRVSWATTTGGFSGAVIEDNDNNWSGDHASNHPDVVPGILFSSRRLQPDQTATIIDMAPTILDVFGVAADDMDGKPLAFY